MDSNGDFLGTDPFTDLNGNTVLGPAAGTGPLAGWLGGSGETGNYQINFSSSVNGLAPVPEPASIALLGIGMIGFAAARRRQKR